MRLIVGMAGATGAVFGVRLLETLSELPEVETHLVLSRWARTTIELETGHSAREVAELAEVTHSPEDQGATISSGSFRTDGVIIAPCSMKTLAGIRAGYATAHPARRLPRGVHADARGDRHRAGGPGRSAAAYARRRGGYQVTGSS